MRLSARHWLLAFLFAIAAHAAIAAVLMPAERSRIERAAGPGGLVLGVVSLPSVASEAEKAAEVEEPVEDAAEAPPEPMRDSVAEPPEATPGAAEAPEESAVETETTAIPLPAPNPLGADRPERAAAEAAPKQASRPAEAQKPKARQRSAPRAPDSGAVASAPAARAGSGGAGGARESGGTADLTDYHGRVLAHLRRHQRYPDAARRAGVEGTAHVTFRIDLNGRLLAEGLARSSGHDLLDREARAMLHRASPFPAIPTNAGRSELAFTVPISFRVR